MQCIREKMDVIDLEDDHRRRDPRGGGDAEMRLRWRDRARLTSNPSALRETVVEVPNVTWDDIGGLENVKRELQETVQYPVEHAEKFEKFGMNAVEGRALLRPAGLRQDAPREGDRERVPGQLHLDQGPRAPHDVVRRVRGERARPLRQGAPGAAPCVIFFDEMDSIAQARGGSGDAGAEAGDRVINQLS